MGCNTRTNLRFDRKVKLGQSEDAEDNPASISWGLSWVSGSRLPACCPLLPTNPRPLSHLSIRSSSTKHHTNTHKNTHKNTRKNTKKKHSTNLIKTLPKHSCLDTSFKLQQVYLNKACRSDMIFWSLLTYYCKLHCYINIKEALNCTTLNFVQHHHTLWFRSTMLYSGLYAIYHY